MTTALPAFDFPPLPYAEWAVTKNTLHLFAQVVGKARLKAHPKLNHWWHVTFYLSPRGFSTRSIPWGGEAFEIEFDLIRHQLIVSDSRGASERFDLPGLSVTDFYQQLFEALARLGIEAEILPRPYGIKHTTPFAEDQEARAYDRDAVHRFWRILLQSGNILERFRGRFLGKSTPVHLFWHSFDLALTRFSGHAAPPLTGGLPSDREAYSHEVISVGFWAGDEEFPMPAFYSYTYPEPEGLKETPLKPAAAFWGDRHGSALAILKYDDLRGTGNPEETLLDFLDSAYQAGAHKAGWPMAELNLPAGGRIAVSD